MQVKRKSQIMKKLKDKIGSNGIVGQAEVWTMDITIIFNFLKFDLEFERGQY